MNFRFDHLVHVVKKPERMIPICSSLGLHAFVGGRHEKWGSYNALSYFGLSYIEFLGIDNWPVARQENENKLITQTVEMLEKGEEGLLRIALRTDHIEKVAEHLRIQGVQLFGPFPGERRREDGSILKWSLLFPENSQSSKLIYPFMIQWEESDEARLEEFKRDKVVGQHELGNGSPTLSNIGFAVRNVEKTVAEWSQLFGLASSEVFLDLTLQARCQKLHLQGTELLFCEPIGEGIVQDVLLTRGEVPFLIELEETGRSDIIETMNCFWRFQ